MDLEILEHEKALLETEYKQVTEERNNLEARLNELRGAYFLCDKFITRLTKDTAEEVTKEKKVKSGN